MSNVSRIYSSTPVSAEVNEAMTAMCEEIVSALAKAKAAGVPQGLVVAVVAGHFHEETDRMLRQRDRMNDTHG